MSDNIPRHAATVEADPTKPWKAIAAFLAPAILAFLQSLIDNGHRHGHHLPVWLWLLISAFAAGVATFSVTNPLRRKRP